MKNSSYIFIALFLGGCFSVANIHATSIDGTTAVQTQATQYAFEHTDTATGYVWFRQGFKLLPSATITLNVVTPVSGEINLNDGTLALTGDLYLASDATLVSDGEVDGGNHACILGNTLTYTSSLTVAENLTIDGRGNMLTLGSTAVVTVADDTTLTLKNMTLNDLSTSRLVMGGTGSKIVFDNIVIALAGDYTLTQGTIDFYNQCKVTGPQGTVFELQTGQDVTIQPHAYLMLNLGIELKHNHATAANNIVFAATDSTLSLLGATINAAGAAVPVFKKGTIVVDHLSAVKGGVTFGHSSDDLSLVFLPAATITVQADT